MKNKKRVEFVIYGLHPALFCSEVDEYFICPVCYFVASEPVSCSECEQIYCQGCLLKYREIKENQCKVCKNPSNVSKLRKFPRKVYESFFLYCPNYNYGCRFEGGIKEIHEHKDFCDYKKLSCLNPLCAHNFLSKDKVIEEAEVCSDQCLEAYQLSEMLGKESKAVISKSFWKWMQDYKKKFAENIDKEFEDLIASGEETKAALEKEVEEIELEFEQVKRFIHVGKYINEAWTCCQGSKLDPGCSELRKA
jgi:hypothetical protein